jgi:small subunit ribosomal protein S21|tara:strand:+ start:1612 stop:1809 length:198 start_codon:yes stop_codon:yes gene_type:complete
MLIIKRGEKDSIDKTLKQYKRKCRETGLLNDIRSRKEFIKPSAAKRKQKLKAIYQQELERKSKNC